MGLRGRELFAAALTVAMLGGCSAGSDEPGQDPSAGSDRFDLVGFLPQDARSYSTVDLTALKRGLGLPPSADPSRDEELARFTGPTLSGVYAGASNRAVIEALDLPAATALAFSPAAAGGGVSAVATSADPEGIRKALLGLGFIDRAGVLEGPDGKRAIPKRQDGKAEVVASGREIGSVDLNSSVERAMAVSFENGVLLVSDSGRLLRGLGAKAGGYPLQVQRSLDGDATLALKLKGGGCVLEEGVATNADSSGTLIFVVDGDPDPSRFSGLGSPEFGEPEVAGNQLQIPLDLDKPEGPADFQAEQLPGYDCSS